MGLSPEFQLVVEYCGRAASRGSADRAPQPSGLLDWALFLRLVRFHRVQGVVWRVISTRDSRFPSEVADAIAADATEIAAANLRAAAASRELLDDFEAAGIPLLFVKGLTLGAIAYGDISTKAAIDIDMVISPADLALAADLLERRGYRLVTAGADRRRFGEWHRLSKESQWARAKPASLVDLHTRLADPPGLIPSLAPNSPVQLVEVANGIRLPTLRIEELFAYVCVHGAWSAWFRLKWITDLVALLHGRDREIESLYRRSLELGAGRAAAQALLLADLLFGTLQTHAGLKEELERKRSNVRLLNLARGQLTGGREPVEPTSRPLGTLRIHLSELALLPGWRSKAAEILRLVRLRLRP